MGIRGEVNHQGDLPDLIHANYPTYDRMVGFWLPVRNRVNHRSYVQPTTAYLLVPKNIFLLKGHAT